MFIRKRGKRWQARVAVKGYPEQVRTFGTEAEGRAWAADVDRKIREGGYAEPDRTTLQGALTRYEKEMSGHKKGAAEEASVIKLIMAHPIAALPLLKVRGADIATYRDYMKSKGNAPATIARHLAILGNLFNTARREWAVDVLNPVQLVRKPVIRNARTRRLAAGELERILAATGSPELSALVTLALETCMRRSELVQLRWRDVDLDRRVAALRDTKNGDPRAVPLSPIAVALLLALPRRIDGKVFGVAPDSVTQAFKRACRRAGIDGLRWHDLRREGITRLFEKGWAIPDVACVSGHKTWSQLARYTAIKPEHLLSKFQITG